MNAPLAQGDADRIIRELYQHVADHSGVVMRVCINETGTGTIWWVRNDEHVTHYFGHGPGVHLFLGRYFDNYGEALADWRERSVR